MTTQWSSACPELCQGTGIILSSSAKGGSSRENPHENVTLVVACWFFIEIFPLRSTVLATRNMDISLNPQIVEPEAHAIEMTEFHKPTEAFTDV